MIQNVFYLTGFVWVFVWVFVWALVGLQSAIADERCGPEADYVTIAWERPTLPPCKPGTKVYHGLLVGGLPAGVVELPEDPDELLSLKVCLPCGVQYQVGALHYRDQIFLVSMRMSDVSMEVCDVE